MCQGAGIACPDIYPMVFPGNGYHGQLNWLASSAAIGSSAFDVLFSASQEGEICLPKLIYIELLSGQTVQLGPHLLTPGNYQLSRHPSMSLEQRDKECIVRHDSSTDKCELGELSDSDEQPHIGVIGAEEVILKEKEEEEKKRLIAARTLKVQHSSDVEEEQLAQHFSIFGEVESIMNPSSGSETTVTFKTIGVAEHLVGKEHFLGEGKVRLRLVGGSSRSPAPSRQQQQRLNVFRYFLLFHIPTFLSKSIRHPHHLSGENLYHLIRWTPDQFNHYCQRSVGATPSTSSLSHEARVFAWRFKFVHTFNPVKAIFESLLQASAQCLLLRFASVAGLHKECCSCMFS